MQGHHPWVQALHAVATAKLEQQIALLQRRNDDLEVHFRKALEERDRVRTDLVREQTITAQVGDVGGWLIEDGVYNPSFNPLDGLVIIGDRDYWGVHCPLPSSAS
jgi:hypothetical protein